MEDEEIESGSSDEDQDHQQLLQQVESLAKKSRIQQRTEPAPVASEYHLTAPESQVSLQSLLGGLGGVKSKSLQALKKRLSTVEERNDPVEPPLNKIQADKANRKAANEEVCAEIGKWAPIVKRNREADHLTFPLQQEQVPAPSLATKLESFTPCTELEKEVAAILASSDNVETEGEELTAAEKKSLFQMTMEEVMERKKALQKHRALVSYYEQKCRRIRRIKSKKFHKIQRRRQEKQGKKSVSEEELVKLRAKERMTLKHSSRAKWARKQHTREHRDPATQQALSEHHNRKTKLKQKVEQEDESMSEDEAHSASEHEEMPDSSIMEPVFTEKSKNPWLNSSGKSLAKSDTRASATKPSTSVSKTSGLIDTESFMVDRVKGHKDKREGGGSLKAASKQLLVVREAFAGDDVVEEFRREKAELEAQETVDDSPVVLPGWGCWGGQGVKPSKKTRDRNMAATKTKPLPPKKRRADAGMKHVIIPEEKRNTKIVEHLVQAVPWPYTSKEQFDKTHCTPVGRHWNTENTFQHMIKPRVTVHSGEMIEPIQLTEEVKSYIKRRHK